MSNFAFPVTRPSAGRPGNADVTYSGQLAGCDGRSFKAQGKLRLWDLLTLGPRETCPVEEVWLIRGEEHLPLNPSLAYAVKRGMRLSYLDRETYRRKSDPDIIASLHREFGSFYLLPEGGSNEPAVRGCAEIPAEIDIDFDVICCACGTGTTLAGIAAGLEAGQQAVGFSSLKGGEFMARDVAELQQRTFGVSSGNWRIEHGFHLGGFARRTAELEAFIADFTARHNLALDWVYVAKMMYGVYALIENGYFKPGTCVVAVITGPPGLE